MYYWFWRSQFVEETLSKLQIRLEAGSEWSSHQPDKHNALRSGTGSFGDLGIICPGKPLNVVETFYCRNNGGQWIFFRGLGLCYWYRFIALINSVLRWNAHRWCCFKVVSFKRCRYSWCHQNVPTEHLFFVLLPKVHTVVQSIAQATKCAFHTTPCLL